MKIEYDDNSYIEFTYSSTTDKVSITTASKDYQENVLLISTVELTKAEYLSLVNSNDMIGLLS